MSIQCMISRPSDH